MRYVLPILLVVLLSTGCVEHRSSVAHAPDSGPARAERLADAYIKQLAIAPSESERDEIRHVFTTQFFSGFTGPEDSLIGSKAAEAGFRAGQDFRRTSSASQVRRTMEEFGYVHTEAEGTWSTGFEVRLFRPRGTPNQRWWFEGFGDTKYVMPKDNENLSGPIYYRVTGFLSPKGQYGHLGGYDHEFYATSVVYLKSGG